MTVVQFQAIAGISRTVMCTWFAQKGLPESVSSYLPKRLRTNLLLVLFGALSVAAAIVSWFTYAGPQEWPPSAWHTKVVIKYVPVPDAQQTALIQVLKERLSNARQRIDWLNSQLKDPPIKTNEAGMETVTLAGRLKRPCIHYQGTEWGA